MATLNIVAPRKNMIIYIENVVLPALKEGYTSGHYDAGTHWDSEGFSR